MSEYQIGYMKPPRETQFKPGQSGNKTGRPRGSKNTYKLLDDLLAQKIQMTQDGKPVRISKKGAILIQAVNAAAKGDHKAIQTLFPHMLAADSKNEEREKVSTTLKQDDKKIIELALKGGLKNEQTITECDSETGF